jgi:hypothetical protein
MEGFPSNEIDDAEVEEANATAYFNGEEAESFVATA